MALVQRRKTACPCWQTSTGTILVKEEGEDAAKVALYTRVSSADQKTDLDRLVSR